MKSDELKATMKQSHRNTNPFLPDEETDKHNFWDSQKLERSIIEDNFITDNENEKLKKSLVPCNVPSDSMEKAKELYIDKNVTECELPGLIACYHGESGFHVVKDICVDEGLFHGEKIEIGKEHHELCNHITIDGRKQWDIIRDDIGIQFSKHERLESSPVENCDINAGLFSATKEKLDVNFHFPDHGNDYNNDDMVEGNVETRFLKRESAKSSSGEDCSDSSFGTKEKENMILLIPEHTHDHRHMNKCNDTEIPGQSSSQGKYYLENVFGEGKLDSISNSQNNSSTEQLASCTILSADQDPLTFVEVPETSNNGVDQHLSEAQSAEELGRSSETVKMEGNNTSNFDHVKPAAIIRPHETYNPELSTETQSATDKVTVANQLQPGAELTFSAAEPVSGLITYTGSVASSGNVSHRSDSSNTSVRSFAFPILQTEWNSSPVRMAKVDPRDSPKHRGWRHALMCCRF